MYCKQNIYGQRYITVKQKEGVSLYFSYSQNERIHFTFIELRDFDSVFSDIYIDYDDKVIFDISEHFNYLMYIGKYNRVNENLINLVKSDWESKHGNI